MFYVSVFLTFSILGYLFEMIIAFFFHIPKQNLLLGPWMMIYGIGFSIIHFLHIFLVKKHIFGKKQIFLFFLISIFLLTLLEYLGGILCEILFCKEMWNYRNIPLSIGTYINVFVSLLWGILSLFHEYLLYPKISIYLEKIPKKITLFLFFLFLLDNIQSILKFTSK